ncbi:glycoside hydrolase family 3 protein [Ceratobasidium sp. AG-Ba]|nr:glycoside hydrolase family 3 protein [Ceratobasidium sp. AG-Ba]QRW01572.1 glycoside hydrolase family 3 protein [Ceratobasidium sp. AG-Ba]
MKNTLLVGSLLAFDAVLAFTPRSWDDAYSLAQAAVSQMTLDEKVGVVTGQGQFSSRCIGNTHAVDRLGIPAFCMNDGPAGIRAVKGVTGFPTGINAASTFSRRLMRARGQAIGEEFRGKGIHIFLGPAMDIMRSPKAGRAWESFGPDPYLNGEGAYETIMGVQNAGVTACAKHLIGNNQEHYRYTYSSDIDDRTLHEVYWWPFLRAIDADPGAFMCAYNKNNQTYSCGDPALLGPNGLLRKEGKFRGVVMSDWGATHDSAATYANAGLDMEQPGDWILIGGGIYGNGLKSAVNNGSVNATRLNEMVARSIAPWYRFGQDSGFPATNFDAQKPDGSGSLNQNVNVRTDGHTALVKEIASASAVLLKNSRTASNSAGLPLALPKTIAIIGQDAKKGSTDCRLNECNDGTMSIGSVFQEWGSGSNSLDFLIAPYDALVSRVGSQGNKTIITSSLSNDLDAAVAAARGKDVALVCVNAMSGELGAWDLVVGNFGDRNDLDLWYKGGSLVERVAAVNNNTIVVVHSVGPVIMNWVNSPNITALIYAGAPGEQTGPSLMDILYGDYNPQGRLPFAVGKSEADYNTNILYNSLPNPTISYTEKLLLDYKYMASAGIKPLFDFGYGLTYGGKFDYSGLSIAPTSTGYTITFKVTNSGTQKATEIPQLYIGFPASAGEPPKNLRGFEEVPLAVGASSTVTMKLSTHYSQCVPGAASTTSKPPTTTASSGTPAPTGVKYWFSFGDSYTSTGFNINGVKPAVGNPLGNPAYPGYTTCGSVPNWIDLVTAKYNTGTVLTYNFAYGGATINASLVAPYTPSIPSLIDQTNTFFANKAVAPWTGSNTVFSIFIGINDIGGSWFQSGDRAAFSDVLLNSYFTIVQKLYDAGGRNFLFINVPHVDRSPREANSNKAVQASVINGFNAKLATRVSSFASSHSGVKTWIYDSATKLNTLLDSPAAYGFQDATSYGSGANLMWCDNYHISSRVHDYFAKDVVALLKGSFMRRFE